MDNLNDISFMINEDDPEPSDLILRWEVEKNANKAIFIDYLKEQTSLDLSTIDLANTIFIAQAKRFHQHKRQLLGIFEVIDRFL